MTARSLAVLPRQPGSAADAASIARRVSEAPMSGTSATLEPVAGSRTAIVLPLSALHQAPSMKHCVWKSLASLSNGVDMDDPSRILTRRTEGRARDARPVPPAACPAANENARLGYHEKRAP